MHVAILQAVASEWVDRYQEASEKAMVELIKYFVLCCGCRATITMEMFQNEETAVVIRSLTENFDEVNSITDAVCIVCESVCRYDMYVLHVQHTCIIVIVMHLKYIMMCIY